MQELCDLGYQVHATYNASRAEALELKGRYPTLVLHQVDFATDSGVDRLVSDLSDVRLDGIVNNAGIFEMDGFAEWDIALWRAVFQVNLTAPLKIVMGLRENLNAGASVVNVASLDGMVGSFSSMAYSASKCALINLSMSLANNFGPRGVRVNSISPGWIDTGMATPESLEAVQITPLGRNGHPEEVAGLISYLLSDKASFLNGANIVIDGGFANVDYIMLQESKRES